MYAGKVASSEAKDILASLEAARDKTIKEAYKEAAEKQKQALATELAAVRAATDAKVALMKEGISKQLTQEEVAYRRRVADLKKRLETEKGLTKKAKAAIQQQIELAEQQHVLNVEKINRAGLDKKIRQEQQNIALRLAAVKQGTDAEYTLKVEQLRKQQEAELANIELTEQQKVLIREKYNKQLDDLSNQWINANLQKQNDALRLEWENRIQRRRRTGAKHPCNYSCRCGKRNSTPCNRWRAKATPHSRPDSSPRNRHTSTQNEPSTTTRYKSNKQSWKHSPQLRTVCLVYSKNWVKIIRLLPF